MYDSRIVNTVCRVFTRLATSIATFAERVRQGVHRSRKSKPNLSRVRECWKKIEREFLSLSHLSLCLFQCDQIGLILKSLGEKVSCKRSPSIWKLGGQFEKGNYLTKTPVSTFGQHLDNIEQLFIPASGHSALTIS